MGITAYGITDWWAQSHGEIIENIWDTWEKDHRLTLPLAIDHLQAKSVFELGCGPGPNLRLLRSKLPDIKLGGCDINPREIRFLREKMKGDFYVGMVPHPIKSSWDVTLSCYCLAYLHPPKVRRQFTITNSRYFVLIEPWGEGDLFRPIEDDVPPKWHHDYADIARGTGWRLAYRWPIAKIDYLETLAIYERS